MGVMSSLVVPVLHDHHLWGLLVAHHSQPRRFGSKELEIVQLVADQVSVALSHAMLLNQSRLRTRHEATINQVITLLHKAPRCLSANCPGSYGQGSRRHRRQTVPQFQQNQKPGQIAPEWSAAPAPAAPIPSARTLARPPRKPHSLPERSLPQLEPKFLRAWRSWPTPSEAPPPNPENYSGPLTTCTSPNCPLPSGQSWNQRHLRAAGGATDPTATSTWGTLSIFRQAINVEFIWAGRLDSTDPRQQRPRQSFETWRELKQGQAQPLDRRRGGTGFKNSSLQLRPGDLPETAPPLNFPKFKGPEIQNWEGRVGNSEPLSCKKPTHTR